MIEGPRLPPTLLTIDMLTDFIMKVAQLPLTIAQFCGELTAG